MRKAIISLFFVLSFGFGDNFIDFSDPAKVDKKVKKEVQQASQISLNRADNIIKNSNKKSFYMNAKNGDIIPSDSKSSIKKAFFKASKN